MFNTIISIINVIRKWNDLKLIEGVVVENREVEELERVDANDWILKPRLIEKKQTQVIVNVLSYVHLGKLITKSENELREEHISLKLKTMVSDHTVK